MLPGSCSTRKAIGYSAPDAGGASPSFRVLRFLPMKLVFQPLAVLRRFAARAAALSAVRIMALMLRLMFAPWDTGHVPNVNSDGAQPVE